ncbi:nucleoside/nucleotide kinase family protein [Lysinibacter cavernae]|uniref:Pantothenate kinase n=1 Tax=Lysinibacter cavernae TaxID=1640652 RepID=A0A7X5R0G5_9MICO|nr:pantothenate kinase [Lysinibacter cavernae]
MNEGTAVPHTFPQLLERAQQLLASPGRSILGITGAPGAGKTTLAEALHHELTADGQSARCALFSMDGFHFANAVLRARGIRDRKGAVDTFDVEGFVSLLRAVQDQPGADGPSSIFAPEFDRALDESIGSAIEIRKQTPLIIVEGNYLLHDADGWERVATFLTESWFVAPAEALRKERLINRHETFGLSPEAAEDWALGTDQRNADLVATTRPRATLVLSIGTIPPILRPPVDDRPTNHEPTGNHPAHHDTETSPQ